MFDANQTFRLNVCTLASEVKRTYSSMYVYHTLSRLDALMLMRKEKKKKKKDEDDDEGKRAETGIPTET